MLAIRLQRRGRTGLVQYRVIVQDSRFSPTGGKVAFNLGSYNPHTKSTQIDAEKAAYYLSQGAQPSPRVVKIFKTAGIKLPKWVAKPLKKKKAIRNIAKLRRNRPPEAAVATPEPTKEPTGDAAEPILTETESEAEKTKAEASPPEGDAIESVDEAKTAVAETPTTDLEEKAPEVTKSTDSGEKTPTVDKEEAAEKAEATDSKT